MALWNRKRSDNSGLNEAVERVAVRLSTVAPLFRVAGYRVTQGRVVHVALVANGSGELRDDLDAAHDRPQEIIEVVEGEIDAELVLISWCNERIWIDERSSYSWSLFGLG